MPVQPNQPQHTITAQCPSNRRASLLDGDLFARAFYTSPVAIAIATMTEGRHLEVNDSFLRQTGYCRDEVIGHTCLELDIWVQPRDWIHIVQMLHMKQTVHEVEITIRTKAGALRQVLTSIEPIEVNGETCLLTTFQDISERRQMEMALRQSEERYQLIARTTSDAVWDWDLVTNAVRWNQGLRTVFGYPEEALRQHTWWMAHVHPDDLATTEMSVQTAIAGGERFWSREYRFQRADDSYAYVLDRGYIVRAEQGLPIRMLGAMVDITERKVHEHALEEREQQYRSIFESVSDGLIVHDLAGRRVDFNPAICQLLGYSPPEFRQVQKEQLIHPASLPRFSQFENALQTQSRYRERLVLVRKDGTTLVADVQSEPFLYHGQRHILVIVRDVSEEAAAYQLLEARVEERTRELSTLLTVGREIASTLELEPLLGLILDQLNQVLPYTAASILSREGELLRGRAYRGPLPQTVVPLVQGTVNNPLDARVLATRQPLIIPDLFVETADVQALRMIAGARFDLYYQGIRCWMRVPLIVKDKAVGVLTLQHAQPAYFSAHHAELALAFADQAAVAIENARLFGALEESRRELSTLLQTSRKVAYTLELNDLLDLILEQLRTVLEYGGASILSLEGETLRGRAYRGPKPRDWIFQFTMSVDNFIDRQVLASRQPYLIPDMWDDTPATRYFRNALGDRFDSLYAGVRAWLRIPLIARDRVVGMLSLHHAEPDFFTVHHADLALAFADQAAVAIENAQLYEQVQQFAATQERQRLARELHDSVSQALYGIALGARTARTLLDRDPKQVGEPLDYVLQLAEAGLAEMRALIFELRPESLAQEGLVVAIEKQAASLRARHQLEVQVNLGPEPEVALDRKEVLYRIAQEALHNIVKHAHARRVHVRLAQQDDALVLAVEDNGQGFDPGGEFPGHLGLKSMRERAIQLGGTLAIESAVGQGTRVYVQIPCK